ncbi:hypothetical protein SDC9_50572 [bioreactor metagenome]|uniref:Uncharacterized protein n=1 Tax=bioreactor metagenome TaxID=1076179 RepID=A0A644WK80_9ZZZZ
MNGLTETLSQKADLDGSGKVIVSQLPSMDYVPTNEKGAPGGVAELDNDGKVPTSQIPDITVDAWPRAETASPATLAKYGATTPNEVLAALNVRTQNSLMRDLNIMLNLSLGTSNIDAWADLLDSTGNINSAVSNGWSLTANVLSQFKINHSAGAQNLILGSNPVNPEKIAQTFTVIAPTTLTTAKVFLAKSNSPTDNIYAYIYATSGGVPTGSALYTSTNYIVGSSLTGTPAEKVFYFTNVPLSANTVYALVFSRTGALDGSNNYRIWSSSSGVYSGGRAYSYVSGVWGDTGVTSAYDLNFEVSSADPATIVWNPVTPTEPLAFAAVCAEQNLGTGTITWYLSDDGTSWTEVTALDTMQQVNFDAAALYLKCVLTGNATVSAVAWGGY